MSASASEQARVRATLQQLLDRRGALDLGHAALLVASHEDPRLETARYLSRLEDMAVALRSRVGPSSPPADAAKGLREYLSLAEGFRGNEENYYDPRNSLLSEVLDRRLGIPVTLSVVWMEVARRAGIPVDGVGMPGHFIVRVGAGADSVLADPFHGGAMLSVEDCRRRVERIHGGKAGFSKAMLDVWDPRRILVRILGNLKGIYAKAGEVERALGVVELLLVADEEPLPHLKDRGLLHASLGCYQRAADDLEGYLASNTADAEAPQLRTSIQDLRRRAALVH